MWVLVCWAGLFESMEWFDVSPNDIALLHLVMAALEPTAQPDVSLVFFVLDRLRVRLQSNRTIDSNPSTSECV